MQIGGIDATSIVEQLMAIERLPLDKLEARKSDAQVAANALAKLSTAVTAYFGAGERLASLADFQRTTSSVSNPDAVAATVSAGATTGSFTFVVDQLAQAEGLRTVDSVASSSVAITTDSVLAVAAGTRSLGVASVRAGAGLGVGDVELTVTQSSAAAITRGTTPLAASTVIDAANNSLDVTVNGVAHTLTIADGTYDADGLTAAVQAALDAEGVAATATLGGDGNLALTTLREGSAATIQVTGGTAVAATGLTIAASASTGTDGVFDVGGTLTTVTSLEVGDSVAVDTGAGTLDVTLSGGLRVGSADVAVVDVGTGSLADVAAAINSASNGVSAAAVKVDEGQWLLQLGATATGEDGRIAIDSSVFGDLGGLVETATAQNARITIGSGLGAYSITASGNTFTNVMAGVALTAKQASGDPITVTVVPADAKIAAEVRALIAAANDVISQIKVQARFDPATGVRGPLAGNATVRDVVEQVRSALTDQIAGLSQLPSSVGIERDREGGIRFDEGAFLAALSADREGVARLFTRGGTSVGDVTFADATAKTASGSYDVVVTTAATRAASGTLFDGGAGSATKIGVRIGTTTATLDVSAGMSRDDIVDELNAAIAGAGLNLVAEDDGTGLRVRAEGYGAAGDFELNMDVDGVGTWDPIAGTDVAGTIDGVAATGVGRTLSLTDRADTTAAGLSVNVTEGITGTVTVDYRPGIAARVAEVTDRLTRAETGVLGNAQEAQARRVEDFNDQIERYEDRLFIRETNMRRKWASFQTLLAGLENQGSWLAGQLATLNTNWAGTG